MVAPRNNDHGSDPRSGYMSLSLVTSSDRRSSMVDTGTNGVCILTDCLTGMVDRKYRPRRRRWYVLPPLKGELPPSGGRVAYWMG